MNDFREEGPQITGPARAQSPLARWAGQVPAILAFTLLGGLAYWGHSTGWKVPKVSDLRSATAEPDDWCQEHGVPESMCVECQPELLVRQKNYGWCKVHGVPECPEHHPDLAEVVGKRNLPQYDTAAALRLVPRAENERDCQLHDRRLQFASAEAVRKAGIDIAVVGEQSMGEYLVANGEVTFDQTRLARVSSPTPGRAWWVGPELGQPVAKGQVLALVDAAEVGRAKGDLLLGLAQVELRMKLVESLAAAKGAAKVIELVAAAADLEGARVKVLIAEQALANLGLAADPAHFKGLTPTETAKRIRLLGLSDGLPESVAALAPGGLLPLRAPFDGEVVTRDVVAGEVLDATKVLFVVADPRRMWLTLHVRQEDAQHVRLKQTVRFRPDKQSPEVVGEVAWISPTVDERTRAVPVRVFLPNDGPVALVSIPTSNGGRPGDEKSPGAGSLRNNAFGTARIVLREEPKAVVVPNAAVHWDGTCHIAFVRDRNYLVKDSPKVFHVRKVVPGAKDATHTELLAGVLPGEVVVTKGSAGLRGELLKANLGEG